MLSSFEKVDATLTRYQDGSYVDGEWEPGVSSTTPLRIVIPQKLTAKDLVMQPQGEKVSDYLKTWSEDEMLTRENLRDSDRITCDGVVYKIFQSYDRTLLGNFFRVVLRKVIS